MDKIQLTKTAVNIVVGWGTSKIVHTIISNNVQPVTVTDTVTVAAGSYVLGSIVADASKQYTNAKIDNAVGWWREHKDKSLKETITG